VGTEVAKVLKLERKSAAASPWIDVLDTFGNPVDLRVRGSLGWREGGWSANLFANYTDSYLNTAVTPNVKVKSQTTYDATASYAFGDEAGWGKGVRISANVMNLFDKAPPIVLNGTSPGTARTPRRWPLRLSGDHQGLVIDTVYPPRDNCGGSGPKPWSAASFSSELHMKPRRDRSGRPALRLGPGQPRPGPGAGRLRRLPASGRLRPAGGDLVLPAYARRHEDRRVAASAGGRRQAGRYAPAGDLAPHPGHRESRDPRDWRRRRAARQPLADLTRAGYVVAVVARRGNGASFGVRRGYEDFTEGFDAYEITEWLAAQPWSNGQIGMYGCSNTGEAVMHALVARPPHLKAAFAGCFAWDRYDGHTRGGIIAQYGTGPTRTIEDDLKATPVQGDEDRVQLRQAAEEHQKSTNLLELMKSMPYRDSWSPLVMAKFWGEVSIGAYLDQVRNSKVPLYIQGGWYDDFRTEGLIAQANLPGQARMVIGPWRHCLNNGFDLRAEQLRFFDHYLKGRTTGIETDAPIHYFTVGAPKGQEWRSTSQWPRPDLRNQLFLSAPT
jgi:hypothetical protein